MRRVIPGLEAPDATLETDIRGRLDRVEEALEKAVVAESDLLAATAKYLLQAGGKRFRPMLVLLSGYFGEPTDPRLVPGSVAIELVHLATLYHDDVIDEADSRRGAPSVNARWDNTVAILTGDYLFARASEISADLGPEVCRLLARTIAILCDGQIREVDASGKVEQTEASYLEVIRRKTGVLISTSCRLGGMLSDADEADVETLGAFGEALGMAFQLSDDIMDVTASQLEPRFFLTADTRPFDSAMLPCRLSARASCPRRGRRGRCVQAGLGWGGAGGLGFPPCRVVADLHRGSCQPRRRAAHSHGDTP